MSPDKKRLLAIVAAVVGLAALAYSAVQSFRQSAASPDSTSRYRTLIDSKTGEVFKDFKIPQGATWPMTHPATGERTLYPTETCYWTKDGQAKLEPTYVLLNEQVGKPGQTLCPDCGRRVVPHNPMPPAELLNKALDAAGR